MQTKMSLQLYQVDSRTYLLDFRSIDGKFFHSVLHIRTVLVQICWLNSQQRGLKRALKFGVNLRSKDLSLTNSLVSLEVSVGHWSPVRQGNIDVLYSKWVRFIC